MVAGIGIGTEMALNGAAAHAFAHIIYKALLLMSAGSVLLMTGSASAPNSAGCSARMPLTTICGIDRRAGDLVVPAHLGLRIKSMISQAAADAHLLVVWLLLAAASAGVFLHAGIKFPWFVFFQKDSGLRPAGAAVEHAAGDGFVRGPVHRLGRLATAAVRDAAVSRWTTCPTRRACGDPAAAAAVLRSRLLRDAGWLKRTLTITLDVDWFYRKLGALLARSLDGRWTPRGLVSLRQRPGARRSSASSSEHHGPEGILARTWPTGSMAFGPRSCSAYLVLSYL